MYVSLGVIIVGNGFFKPNISVLRGNLYNKEELKPIKDNAYNIFYMGINIGALFCNFVAAYLRNAYGWGYAFAAAGIGLIIGLIWLALQVKHVKEADIKRPMEPGDMPISKIFISVFLPMIVFGIIGWFIPGNIMNSDSNDAFTVSYTHLRAHETVLDLVCRLLLEKKNQKIPYYTLRHLHTYITLHITI